MVDILVIGAGPAGLSAAIYSSRAGYKVKIVDPMGSGGQLLFIDELENYPGVEKISGFELSEKLEKQALSFGVEMEFNEVKSVAKNSKNIFDISFADGSTEQAKAVIVATGATHRELGCKGEKDYQGRGVSYCATCDGPFFKGKNVVVVGGGDTALTDALYLSKLTNEVVLVHRRNEFRAQKILQDRVKERDNITLRLSNQIVSINGDGKKVTSVTLSDGEEVPTDAVFIFVRITPNSSFISKIVGTEAGFIVTNNHMESSVPGLFAAGDVRTTPFRQVVTAASDGANASHAADEYISGFEEAIIKLS